MSSASASALVIGGGVIGRTCALALQRSGWQVTLTDSDTMGTAPSWGNAGHIAVEQTEPLSSFAMLKSAPMRLHVFGGALDLRNPLQLSPWIAQYLQACTPTRFKAGCTALSSLLAEALPAWKRLVHTINSPDLLQQHGHWLCWESAVSARRGESIWRNAKIGTASITSLKDEQHAALQANLSTQITGGLAINGTAQISDLSELARRLSLAFIHAGGKQHTLHISKLQSQGRRVHAIAANGTQLNADLVLVCAGVRSRNLMDTLRVRAPLISERGYHLQWASHDWPQLPPIVFEDRSMILTRFTGGLRAASFVEYAQDNTPPDPKKWMRLHKHVHELGVPIHGEPTPWMGARPTLPDYLPALGRSTRFDNLAYAFGHQHLGLTLAAISAELMADLSANRKTAITTTPFDLDRFA